MCPGYVLVQVFRASLLWPCPSLVMSLVFVGLSTTPGWTSSSPGAASYLHALFDSNLALNFCLLKNKAIIWSYGFSMSRFSEEEICCNLWNSLLFLNFSFQSSLFRFVLLNEKIIRHTSILGWTWELKAEHYITKQN